MSCAQIRRLLWHTYREEEARAEKDRGTVDSAPAQKIEQPEEKCATKNTNRRVFVFFNSPLFIYYRIYCIWLIDTVYIISK